jgi:hypothetical protein
LAAGVGRVAFPRMGVEAGTAAVGRVARSSKTSDAPHTPLWRELTAVPVSLWPDRIGSRGEINRRRANRYAAGARWYSLCLKRLCTLRTVVHQNSPRLDTTIVIAVSAMPPPACPTAGQRDRLMGSRPRGGLRPTLLLGASQTCQETPCRPGFITLSRRLCRRS